MPVSLLWPPADSGDCQHFVALCEVIRAIDAGRVSIQLLHAFFSVCINDNIAYTVLHCTDISGDLAIDAGSNHPTLRFGAENPGRLRVLLGHAESPLPVLTRQATGTFPSSRGRGSSSGPVVPSAARRSAYTRPLLPTYILCKLTYLHSVW